MDEKSNEGEVKSMPKDDKPQAPNPEPEQEIDLSTPCKKDSGSEILEVPEQDTGDDK